MADCFSIFTQTAAICAAAVFAVSCSNDPDADVDEENEFHTIQKKIEAKMTLERGLQRLDYQAGRKGQVMTFLLKNADLKNVEIPEWHMEESENIRLYYAVCEAGHGKSVSSDKWQLGWPAAKNKKSKKGKNAGRKMPCLIAPNNRIMLDVPMDFLENFQMNGKSKCVIAVRAEMALNTLEVSSPVYELEIRPCVMEISVE